MNAVLEVAGIVFAAGGIYWQVRRTRQDLNGLGRQMRADRATNDRRHQKVLLATMLLAPKEEQGKIAEILKDS